MATTDPRTATEAQWSDLVTRIRAKADNSALPTKTSDLTNDSDYQTGTQVSTAIASAVEGIAGFDYEVVSALPTTGKKGTIYLVANSGTAPNVYDEYIWVNSAFEKIGTTEIDLSNYVTNTALTNALAAYTATADLATVATSGSYTDLANKPTIPTVNNATLTIQKNGSNVATFTANSASNATANITVPTNTNELTNGAGFITSTDLPATFITSEWDALWA